MTVFSVNLTIFFIGILALELVYGKWFSTKAFVPNILPKHGISHDLSLLSGNSDVTTRVPDENGAILYSAANNRDGSVDTGRCNILILGGSTAEERILDKYETWSYRLFSELNTQRLVQSVCQNGVSVTNAAVNGHSVVANYFDVI